MNNPVRNWLQATGFEQYVEIFETNEIDYEMLASLTNEHLKDLGIPLGPRIKLLKAIRESVFDTNSVSVETTSASRDLPNSANLPNVHAERRQLTVMFVDLVGSTALAGRLDPEDLRDVVQTYQKVVADEVANFEGYLAQYLGDGALAYFGYPVAHEDDAERAIYAALAILAKVGSIHLETGEPLSIRVGIATGIVVVGEMLGAGKSKEHSATGETPNIAARLQNIASPDQVVISQTTRHLVGELFELESLGRQELKGVSSPVLAYTVIKENVVTSRFESRSRKQLSELVGREGELLSLMERWDITEAGEGQVVIVVGDPGIGKSRILRAMKDSLDTDAYTRISYQCSPHYTGSALYVDLHLKVIH